MDIQESRRQIFAKIYMHMAHWHAQIENGTMTDIIMTPECEEVYFGDLLVGLPLLSERERPIFPLIYLQGYPQTAVMQLLPADPGCPVKMASRTTLTHMINEYD